MLWHVYIHAIRRYIWSIYFRSLCICVVTNSHLFLCVSLVFSLLFPLISSYAVFFVLHIISLSYFSNCIIFNFNFHRASDINIRYFLCEIFETALSYIVAIILYFMNNYFFFRSITLLWQTVIEKLTNYQQDLHEWWYIY